MGAEWILLVATTKQDEMIVGSLSVLAAGVFLLRIHQTETLRLRFKARDILAVWRVPAEVLSDLWMICVVLVRDLAGDRANSFYRVCEYTMAKDDPTRSARSVLATVYTTASPNFIVIGVDNQQSRMLFHQIKRSGISKLTQILGAKP